MNRLLLALVIVLSGIACKKDPPPAPVVEKRPPTPAAPPASGTDADSKRIEALDLAVKIDNELPTLERGEKSLKDGRKVEAFIARGTPPMPRKIVISAVDDKDNVTDLYYNDRGLLTFARAPDGLFIFQLESLSLWLDRDQKVKRGVNPSLVKPRVDGITADSRAALGLFGLR